MLCLGSLICTFGCLRTACWRTRKYVPLASVCLLRAPEHTAVRLHEWEAIALLCTRSVSHTYLTDPCQSKCTRTPKSQSETFPLKIHHIP